VAEIDGILRTTAPQASLVVGLISNGEQVERPGLTIDSETRKHNSPSGVIGAEHNHRFRASGWTRHYETFAESLQIIALLALGLALANLRNHGVNGRFRLAIVASIILALGIAVTAMRTVLLAFVVAAIFIVWRSLRKKAKLAFVIAILALLICGGLIVWKTRAPDAISLADPSSTLRGQVARVGLSRLMIHPIFGHGMDAMQAHWNEWGFPGHDMLHLHSTPLQLAFDRGLPALLLWLWIIGAFWFWTADAERASRDSSDTNRFGILLGSFGAVTGFFLSSLVNYNFGDAEVAMLFWWLMGIVVALTRQSD
jgi:O-antigen ligase